MNIVLMTNSLFAENIIEALQKHTNLIAITTGTDKEKGRGQRIQKSHIKEIAEKYKIKIYQPRFLKENKEFENTLKKLNPDLLIVYSYGFIIPKSILNIAKLDSLNIHTSLLPKYRGASPIHSVLLNQEKFTGITIQTMSEKLDAGDIIYQEKIEILDSDNYITLEKTLSNIASKSIPKIINLYKKNQIIKIKQDKNKISYCKKILKTDGKINWQDSYNQIQAKIKAYINWPKSYTFYKNKKIIIHKIKLINNKKISQPGTILKFNTQGIQVQCQNGLLNIIELQKENGKKMNYKDFINGNTWEINQQLK